MFKTKDYLEYFKQLYKVELMMKEEGETLLGLITDPEAQEILHHLVEDEKRHIKIVKQLMTLV